MADDERRQAIENLLVRLRGAEENVALAATSDIAHTLPHAHWAKLNAIHTDLKVLIRQLEK